MPVKLQKMIYRRDLAANPDHLYVFGDNVMRVGLGGQAKEMRGAPNAIGIATKQRPTMDHGAFFSDENYAENIAIIKEDLKPIIKHLMMGKVVVIPSDGLGTGLSELPKRAPMINGFLIGYIDGLISRFGVIE